MINEERREHILFLLERNHSVKVSDLSEELFIGEATIRRDLKKLEQAGYLKRVYGGAIRIDQVDREMPADVRVEENADFKRSLCAKAAKLIQPGNVISIDSSTTTFFLADYLYETNSLTVLCQGQKLIDKLLYAPLNLYSSGGILSKTTLSYTGAISRSFFSSFFVDISFISCKGISMHHGLSWIYEEEADLRRIMLDNARTRVLLCDHTKFGIVSSCKLFGFERIDYLITNEIPSPEWIEFFEKTNVKLIISSNDQQGFLV